MSNDNPGQPGYGQQPPPPPGYGQPPPPPPGWGAGPPPSSSGAGGQMSFDRSKLGLYDGGLAAAAVLFFIALLLPWVHVSFKGGMLGNGLSASANGFHSGLLWFAWILLIAAAAWAILPALGVSIATPFPRTFIVLACVGIALLFTIIEFFNVQGGGSDVPDIAGLDAGASVGAYLGLLVAIAAAVIAVLLFLAQQGGRSQPPLPAKLGGGMARPHAAPTQTATWSAPANQPPAAPPAQQPPAYQPPAQQPPAYQPPAYEPPAQQPPAYEPPAQQPPAYEPPAQQPPAFEPPAQEPPSQYPPSSPPPAPPAQ